jgi:O-antigen/teichoic acid export membrane protein
VIQLAFNSRYSLYTTRGRRALNSYFFSIFVRGAIALSGFLVFLVSSKLFGADGRGVMSYGVSVFTSLGLLLSFNLGRGFIAKTERDEERKKRYLFSFWVLNLASTIMTVLLGWAFWLASGSAQRILESRVVMALMAISLFSVWNINGNSLFAAFQKTKQQEFVILATRLVLTVFLGVFLILGSTNFILFLSGYTAILALGVLSEWLLLGKILHGPQQILAWMDIRSALSQSFWPHVDFLAFNLFPLLLILIAGQYIERSSLGRISFAIQIINLVFLLSTTANIRISAYVSVHGFGNKLQQIKKLFWGTFVLSSLGALAIIPILNFLTSQNTFNSFAGVGILFKIAVLSLPGFLTYQFLYPLWLENGMMRISAIFNLVSLAFACAITPFLVSHFEEKGALWSFTIFHFGCLLSQLLVYRKFKQGQRLRFAAGQIARA